MHMTNIHILSDFSRIIPNPFHYYYSRNYSGIIDTPLFMRGYHMVGVDMCFGNMEVTWVT